MQGSIKTCPISQVLILNPTIVTFLGVSFWVNDIQMEMLVGLDFGGTRGKSFYKMNSD
jgi:hypothetical protein